LGAGAARPGVFFFQKKNPPALAGGL